MKTLTNFRYAVIACLALVGLAEATYLTVLALTGEMALCGSSAGCAEVLGSSYARITGVPVAAFGSLAYFTVFSLATLVAFGYRKLRVFLAATVYAMFAFTLWLSFVQAFRIHAFCRYCLFSAALVTFLTGLVIVSSPADDEAEESSATGS